MFLKGVPQLVSNGAVPMAIWVRCFSLDLITLQGAKANIHIKNPYVPFGGCHTPRLYLEDQTKMHDGVQCSLSLANLLSYGDPIYM